MIIWVDKTKAESSGFMFAIASFLDEKTCPEGIIDDQLTESKLHNTADELIKDAEALNSPSSKVQYIGKLEVQVEMT